MTIKLSDINQKLASLLVQTTVGNFTPIINFGDTLVSIYVSKKYGEGQRSFEAVKEEVLPFYLKFKEQEIIKNFLNKKRREAKIQKIG